MGAQPRLQLLLYDKNNRNGNVKHKTKHLVIRKAGWAAIEVRWWSDCTEAQADLRLFCLHGINRYSPDVARLILWRFLAIFTSITVVQLNPHKNRSATKPTKSHVRPAKTQTRLGIRPVWSVSSLCAWRNLGSLATHWALNEASYQTGRMTRLICVFAGRTGHFVGFVVRRL